MGESREQIAVEALKVAADDLGKAANQFASMHESQQHGHYPDIRSNHHIFAEKEAKARAALAALDGAGGRQDEERIKGLEERLADFERRAGFTEECAVHKTDYSAHCGACSVAKRVAAFTTPGQPLCRCGDALWENGWCAFGHYTPPQERPAPCGGAAGGGQDEV